MAESKLVKLNMAEFKMAAIIKLSQNEWVKVFLCAKWLNPKWQNSISLPSSSWVRMNEWSLFLWKMAESKMAEFMMAEYNMAAIIKLSDNEWVWVKLN